MRWGEPFVVCVCVCGSCMCVGLVVRVFVSPSVEGGAVGDWRARGDHSLTAGALARTESPEGFYFKLRET